MSRSLSLSRIDNFDLEKSVDRVVVVAVSVSERGLIIRHQTDAPEKPVQTVKINATEWSLVVWAGWISLAITEFKTSLHFSSVQLQ